MSRVRAYNDSEHKIGLAPRASCWVRTCGPSRLWRGRTNEATAYFSRTAHRTLGHNCTAAAPVPGSGGLFDLPGAGYLSPVPLDYGETPPVVTWAYNGVTPGLTFLGGATRIAYLSTL